MKKEFGKIIYSPSDLIRYLSSPFASWLDRYYLEYPGAIIPDEETEEEKLFSRAGDQHEQGVLAGYRDSSSKLVEIAKDDCDFATAHAATLEAIKQKSPIIYQAALQNGAFAGYADFLLSGHSGKYQPWDAKLALSPKPYYPIQLCCYSEMLACADGQSLPQRIGVILGNGDRVEYLVEDFIHYYRHIRDRFLAMQAAFDGNIEHCPEPLPHADHGRWASRAVDFFIEKDHFVQVANITVGQMKKLKAAGIVTMTQLAAASGKSVANLDGGTQEKLVAQAQLQCDTRADRLADPNAKPRYVILPHTGTNGEPVGLATLPPANVADVFFDMEGYPIVPGGLEYLFGVWSRNESTRGFEFRDWWAHSREEEKVAFEGFVDWVYARWKSNSEMHIYHYAPYECAAVRRLSTRHDTRQDEVDDLLRSGVFVDLYQIVRRALRIGEKDYSLKTIEVLYRPKRATDVASASESIVQYAAWMVSGQPPQWNASAILKSIREYNEDDCKSNAELTDWLRKLVNERRISYTPRASTIVASAPKQVDPKIAKRQQLAIKLHTKGDVVSIVLADLIDFHRRENKPMWWRMFDRAEATLEEMRDDSGCIENLQAHGACVTEKRSLLQTYHFDPSQECKLDAGDMVMFNFVLSTKFTIAAINLDAGEIVLKISKKKLDDSCQGRFPTSGSIIKYEFIAPGEIPDALSDLAVQQLSGALHPAARSLLERAAPGLLHKNGESPLESAIRLTASMSGGCLVIQGPPGTGKTYTASRVIEALLSTGKKVGIASNSHKAIVNLLSACSDAARKNARKLVGIKVGDEPDNDLHKANPGLIHIKSNPDGRNAYTNGIVGGTAWLFSRPEWQGVLDFLFIDEAGQVPLANAVAMVRSANNLVLLGDQMQLEQPVQGSHPGDAGLSCLHYALKDIARSKVDEPYFHAVVPANLGLFLSESYRMHPNVCRFISESIYENRLSSIPDTAKQKITDPDRQRRFVRSESGIALSGIKHEGNVQRSDEEVGRVKAIYQELVGFHYTAKNGTTKPLELDDFLFIAPYNAQVRALKAALPKGARVGSVDRFQGQEAAVCILSMCSSYGEYGSRGLKFILDRSRINVSLSRAKCLAIVVGDPRIADSASGSIDDMELLNIYCKIVHL
jgi:predicted RecB family nuclease